MHFDYTQYKQRGFAPIILIVLVALGIGGYFIYRGQVNVVPSRQTNVQPSSTPTVIPSPISTPSATLKTQPKTSLTPSSPPKTVYSSTVKLESVSPNIANSGEEIKLLGSGFGTVTGKVYLYNQILGSSTVFTEAIPNRWTDTELKITVPPAVGGQTINVEIIHKDGTKSNRAQFQIKGGQPRIDTIYPKSMQPLQEITISGKEFGSNNGSVNIHKTDSGDISSPYAQCQNISWGDTSIRCKLPSTVNNGTEYGFEIVSSDNRRSSFIYYKVGS